MLLSQCLRDPAGARSGTCQDQEASCLLASLWSLNPSMEVEGAGKVDAVLVEAVLRKKSFQELLITQLQLNAATHQQQLSALASEDFAC